MLLLKGFVTVTPCECSMQIITHRAIPKYVTTQVQRSGSFGLNIVIRLLQSSVYKLPAVRVIEIHRWILASLVTVELTEYAGERAAIFENNIEPEFNSANWVAFVQFLPLNEPLSNELGRRRKVDVACFTSKPLSDLFEMCSTLSSPTLPKRRRSKPLQMLPLLAPILA